MAQFHGFPRKLFILSVMVIMLLDLTNLTEAQSHRIRYMDDAFGEEMSEPANRLLDEMPVSKVVESGPKHGKKIDNPPFGLEAVRNEKDDALEEALRAALMDRMIKPWNIIRPAFPLRPICRCLVDIGLNIITFRKQLPMSCCRFDFFSCFNSCRPKPSTPAPKTTSNPSVGPTSTSSPTSEPKPTSAATTSGPNSTSAPTTTSPPTTTKPGSTEAPSTTSSPSSTSTKGPTALTTTAPQKRKNKGRHGKRKSETEE